MARHGRPDCVRLVGSWSEAMEKTMKTVGSYEAKTHLPKLLDEVAAGQTITITKHGVPVAMLVPADGGKHPNARQVIEQIKRLRKGRKLGGVSIRELIAGGRRY